MNRPRAHQNLLPSPPSPHPSTPDIPPCAPPRAFASPRRGARRCRRRASRPAGRGSAQSAWSTRPPVCALTGLPVCFVRGTRGAFFRVEGEIVVGVGEEVADVVAGDAGALHGLAQRGDQFLDSLVQLLLVD